MHCWCVNEAAVFLHSAHINPCDDVIMSYLLCSQICKYRGWGGLGDPTLQGDILIQGLKASDCKEVSTLLYQG